MLLRTLLLSSFFGLLLGCGVKGPPLPPAAVTPMQSDLTRISAPATDTSTDTDPNDPNHPKDPVQQNGDQSKASPSTDEASSSSSIKPPISPPASSQGKSRP